MNATKYLTCLSLALNFFAASVRIQRASDADSLLKDRVDPPQEMTSQQQQNLVKEVDDLLAGKLAGNKITLAQQAGLSQAEQDTYNNAAIAYITERTEQASIESQRNWHAVLALGCTITGGLMIVSLVLQDKKEKNFKNLPVV